MPTPCIVHILFLKVTFAPSFFIALIDATTSSEINRFLAFEIPFASEDISTHLILILLSPGISIFLLKLEIFFLE